MPHWRSYALAGAVTLLIAGLVFGAQGRVQDALLDPVPQENIADYDRAYPDKYESLDPNRRYYGEGGLKVEQVLNSSEIFGIFPPVTDVAPPARRHSSFNATWYLLSVTAAALLMIAAILATAFRVSFHGRPAAVGAATLIALLAAPPILHLYDYLRNGAFEPIVPRFGLSALPFVAVLVGSLAAARPARVVLYGVTGSLYVTALLTLT